MKKTSKPVVEPLIKVHFFKADIFFIAGARQTDIKEFDRFQGQEFLLSSDDVNLELASKDGKTRLNIEKKRLYLESYSQKYESDKERNIIFCTGAEGKGKEIVVEYYANEEVIKQVKKIIFRRNDLMHYQGSLSLNPSCIPRQSFFTNENANLDLRGFINLGILLLFSNNFMLIIENFLKYGFLIQENVAFD